MQNKHIFGDIECNSVTVRGKPSHINNISNYNEIIDPEDFKMPHIVDKLEQQIKDLQNENGILKNNIKKLYSSLINLNDKINVIDSRTKKKKDDMGALTSTIEDLDI